MVRGHPFANTADKERELNKPQFLTVLLTLTSLYWFPVPKALPTPICAGCYTHLNGKRTPPHPICRTFFPDGRSNLLPSEHFPVLIVNSLQTQLVFLKDPQQNLIFLTNRVGRQLSRLLLERMEFEEFLPQSTHMGLLADLMTNDGLRQQDLAISTIKDKGTVARGLKQLETAGMITREVDPEDRRQKRIYLTEKAHRMWAYVQDHADHTICCAQKGISPEELRVCTNVLNKIYHNLHLQLSIPKSTNHE